MYENKNIEAQAKFPGSYKKRRVYLNIINELMLPPSSVVQSNTSNFIIIK